MRLGEITSVAIRLHRELQEEAILNSFHSYFDNTGQLNSANSSDCVGYQMHSLISIILIISQGIVKPSTSGLKYTY